MQYNYRNGETTPPDRAGHYWFSGLIHVDDGSTRKIGGLTPDIVCIIETFDPERDPKSENWVVHPDYTVPFAWLEGRWWGQINTPDDVVESLKSGGDGAEYHPVTEAS